MQTYEAPPVVVTGTRIPTKLSELTRSVTIITKEELKTIPYNSLPELLNALIDIRQRNIQGVQADASIRGTSFEQVLILLDGIPLSDPQTGHHNLDVPLLLEDIEQIEILKGQASSLYGANAVGGVINIITQKTMNETAQINYSYGSHRIYNTAFSNTMFNTRLSLERNKSAGYKYDTDFDNLTISFKSIFRNKFNTYFGLVDKDFGAYHFYGPYPSKEKTTTKFVSISILPIRIGQVLCRRELLPTENLQSPSRGRSGPLTRPCFTIEPKFYYREHYDKFILYRETPSVYSNKHINQSSGGEVTCYSNNIVLGMSANKEEIDSKGIRSGIEKLALGEHSRQNTAIYGEYRPAVAGFHLLTNIGTRIDFNSQYGNYLSYSSSLGYALTPQFNLRSSFGKAFRAPSFTELYYQDPANIGDSTLTGEEVLSYEVGANYELRTMNYELLCDFCLFLRDQYNLIDWVKENTSDATWEVKNIGEAVTRGAEITLKLGSFTTEYTFIKMDSKLPLNYISKYACDYPEHQLSCKGRVTLPLHIDFTPIAVFKKRVEGKEGYYTLDVQLSRKIKNCSLSFSTTNLLNTKYEDVNGVELPGRWLSCAVKIEM